MAEDIRHSALGKETYSKRSQTIERVFADAKEKHAMRYTPYRGLNQVANWVRLKFVAMNLKEWQHEIQKQKNQPKSAFWKRFFVYSFIYVKYRVSLDCDTRFFDSLRHPSQDVFLISENQSVV